MCMSNLGKHPKLSTRLEHSEYSPLKSFHILFWVAGSLLKIEAFIFYSFIMHRSVRNTWIAGSFCHMIQLRQSSWLLATRFSFLDFRFPWFSDFSLLGRKAGDAYLNLRWDWFWFLPRLRYEIRHPHLSRPDYSCFISFHTKAAQSLTGFRGNPWR